MYAFVKPALSAAGKKLTRWVVLGPLFWLPEEKRTSIERRLRGREQFRKLRKAELVIVSFGKSGRTWLRVMLSRFYQVRHGFSERSLIGFDNLHLRNKAVPRIFFTHDNYTKDYTGHVNDKQDYYDRKVILLARHPADVAVSQYHQWKFRMKPGKKTINDYPEQDDLPLFNFVAHHEAGLPKVIEFLNGWARELPRLKEVLIVRFEDMKADPGRELGRMLAFAGTPGSEAEIAESVRFGSFENMRKLETSNKFWMSGGRMTAADKSNPQSFKTRRGEAGGWRKDFTPEQVAEIEAIIERQLLPGFGYLKSEAQPAPAA